MIIPTNPAIYAHIGLEENIVLQQLHYFLQSEKTTGFYHQGKKWIYNTLTQWSDMLRLSEGKVRRAFKTLNKLGLVKAEKLKKSSWWHTKHYTIDYAALQVFFAERGLSLDLGKALQAEENTLESLDTQVTDRSGEIESTDLLESTNHKQKHPLQKIQQQTNVAVFSEENEEREAGASPAQGIQEDKSENPELVRLLTDQGVVKPVALALVSDFSEEEIQNQVAWLPYRKYDEPGAFLKTAIQRKFAPPKEVKDQLARLEKQEKREEEKMLQTQARKQFEVGQKLKTPSGKIAQIRLIMSNALECMCDGISASIPFEKALKWDILS